MTADRHRLFLALWPDSATRAQLAARANQHTQHPIAADNLHMTLAFLGNCDQDKWQCIDNVISTIISEPFELNIDYLGAWSRSRTQWLGTSCAPKALGELVQALNSALLSCDFQSEQRRFVPHITLSRKQPNPAIQAGLDVIRWPVNEFVLAESLSVPGGVRYVVHSRWPLAGGAKTLPL